jgi:hypothetical protein
MSHDLSEFLAAFNSLPNGNFEAYYLGRRYGVTKTLRDGERQAWFWAEERGGADKVSFNLYFLKSGPRLKPCEMPDNKVIDFVLCANPIQ